MSLPTASAIGPNMWELVVVDLSAMWAGPLCGQLLQSLGGARGPVFCGDAIADPLTGLEAAHAVVASLGRGGGELIDVAMAGVAAEYAKVPVLEDVDPLGDGEIDVAAPRAPRFPGPVFESVDDKWVIDLVEKRRGPGC
ncbi:crotonobetainyl-CoA:carnitine CoA-transferase CaiB-like acyl-CoA transferase [Williamsia sp. R60]